MSMTRSIGFICLLAFGFQAATHAQVGLGVNAARELVEAIAAKGGQQAAKELAEMGGEVLAREALEKAAEEGGEPLVRKLSAQALEQGPALLKVAKSSPAAFVSAFDELTPAMRKAAAQAITREPELMAQLFSKAGKEALTAAAMHPGVGTKVMEALGHEGAETLGKITTDEAIQLSRLAPEIAKVAEPGRGKLLELIGKAPGKIMDILEEHPKVLISGAALAAFLASKDQLLGGKHLVGIGPDGKPIFQEDEGFMARALALFRNPVSGLIGVIGVAVAGYAGIKLWGAWRVEKAKVRTKEARLRGDDRTK